MNENVINIAYECRKILHLSTNDAKAKLFKLIKLSQCVARNRVRISSDLSETLIDLEMCLDRDTAARRALAKSKAWHRVLQFLSFSESDFFTQSDREFISEISPTPPCAG